MGASGRAYAQYTYIKILKCMKIGIDARMYGKGFGLARYVEELIHGLEKSSGDFEYVLFMKPEGRKDYQARGGKYEVVEAPFHWYGWEEQIKFSSRIKKTKLDLMHFPHWNVPVIYHDPYIVTIHDLTMFHFPRYEASTKSKPVYWVKDKAHRFVVGHAARHAKSIIATSEFTKSDIMRTLSTSPDKISVVYQAPYTQTVKEASGSFERIQNVYNLNKKYILYVGAAYPHKNLIRLLNAWKIISDELRDYELILVGKQDNFYTKIENHIKEKQIANVRLLGFVEDTELGALYAHASLFVYPSLYEGFGLPPLEALSYGVPVVASSAASIPEVLGEAAYFVDPLSVEAIGEGIQRVLGSDDIIHELKVKGRAQRTFFSEHSFIEATLKVYTEAVLKLK